RSLRQKRHPLLGHATINVGSINGGKQPNIVPDDCAISIDRRMLPGESNAQVIRELKNLLRENGLSAHIDSLQGAPCGPLETSLSQPLVQEFLHAVRQKAP